MFSKAPILFYYHNIVRAKVIEKLKSTKGMKRTRMNKLYHFQKKKTNPEELLIRLVRKREKNKPRIFREQEVKVSSN